MIETIRLHGVINDHWSSANDGTVSTEFRGEHFIGKAQGDHHKTWLEWDVDDSTTAGRDEIAAALFVGPAVNKWLQGQTKTIEADLSAMEDHVLAFLGKVFSKLAPIVAEVVSDALNIHPRFGVWSKKAEDGS